MKHKPLSGRTALITGASAGIGRATAEELAIMGARVVVTARRRSLLDSLVRAIEAKDGEAKACVLDASNLEQIMRVWEQSVAWAGKLDTVVVNAGRGLAGGLLSSDASQWEQIYKLDVLGAAHLMRLAAGNMVQQGGGDIVVLGSVSGLNISPFSGFYGSSKFAITAAAEALRREVAAKSVRVTVIKPGIVLSEFQDQAGYEPSLAANWQAKFGKLLEPQDVARAVGFVVSQPPHVHINDIVIRPTGQDYP